MKYDFDTIIPRRGTNSYKWDTPEEENVLPMWVADMDFRTAPTIVEALQRRVAHGIFGYTKVPETYYDAVVRWFESRHRWRIDPRWIIYTSGTQMPINPDVIKLSILDNAGAATTSNEVTISGDDIAKLNTYKLNYKNNEGNTKDFTIMVPVKVTYAWGEVEAAVAIAVKGTIANR